MTESEASRRISQAGPNRLARTKPVPALRIFIRQLTGVVVLLLAAAVLAALALGDIGAALCQQRVAWQRRFGVLRNRQRFTGQ